MDELMTTEAHDDSPDWRAYFARFGPRLILFARQWLPDVADAEDAVQEAFVRFWRKYRNPSDGHAGLLFVSVRSVAIDHIRRETRRKRRETAASNDSLVDEQNGISLFDPTAAEAALPLEAALRQLPTKQREVLVLKIWGELTFAQIGEALGLPPNSAASCYRYAINNLKKIIRPVCYE